MLKVIGYPVPMSSGFSVLLAADTQVLGVEIVGGQPFMSMLVNPLDDAESVRNFVTLRANEPTEHKLSQLKYVGSFSFRNDTFVYHLFELLK